MDFLSWRKLHPEGQDDSIILNSLTLLPKLIPTLHPYPIIENLLDNDEAGDEQRNNSSTLAYPSRICERATLPIKTSTSISF